MKKDQPRQDRRQRALERFKIIQNYSKDPKRNAEYLERKNVELAALKRALGKS